MVAAGCCALMPVALVALLAYLARFVFVRTQIKNISPDKVLRNRPNFSGGVRVIYWDDYLANVSERLDNIINWNTPVVLRGIVNFTHQLKFGEVIAENDVCVWTKFIAVFCILGLSLSSFVDKLVVSSLSFRVTQFRPLHSILGR